MCIILYALDWEYTCIFLVFGIMLIVISYYSQMNSKKQTKEKFGDCYVDNPVHIPETGPRVDGFDTQSLNNGINRQKKEIGTPWEKDFKLNHSKRHHGYTNVSSIDNLDGNAVSSHGYLTRDDVDNLFKGGERVVIGKDIQPVNIPHCRNCSSNIVKGWCQGCGMSEGRVDNKKRHDVKVNGGIGNDPMDSGKTINRNSQPQVWHRNGKLEEENWPQAPGENDYTEFVYDRLDPQFVRNPETLDPARAAEMPCRTPWSRKMSRFEAASNTVPIDSISTTNFDEYTIGYKNMKDLPGPYKYQAPEAAYQYPVFNRSNVDHILYLNPMYGIMPEQSRTGLSLDESKSVAESQWLKDTQNSRTDIMENYIDKMASVRMQQKVAPMSSAWGKL
jgi:hypothetical protein